MSHLDGIQIVERLCAFVLASVEMTEIRHRNVEIDGIATHYLEAGSGTPLVLLHSGEFGASAELSWEQMLPMLAEHHLVIAPDWLGYGETDKVYDFGGNTARRMRHMTALLKAIGIAGASFVGTSMGGSLLARVAAAPDPIWPIDAIVLISGGGFAPLNDAREVLLDYDGTAAGMRRMLAALLHDPTAFSDDEYVARRVALSTRPGAWEAIAAARFKSPQAEPLGEFGQPDKTPYEAISVPALIVAGREDRLREPGYAEQISARVSDSRLHVLDRCGHLPNVERPAETARLVLDFLQDIQVAGSRSHRLEVGGNR